MKITDITLETVKQYLRIDFNDDDSLIQMMLDTAKNYIESYVHKKFEDMVATGEDIPDEWTIACLSIISHWYENRTIVGDKNTGKEIVYMFKELLDMHRNILF